MDFAVKIREVRIENGCRCRETTEGLKARPGLRQDGASNRGGRPWRDLYLTFDVGTGGLRAALVDRGGAILAYAHAEHEQILPRHGWSEQRPEAWWTGTQDAIRAVLTKVPDAARRIAAAGRCMGRCWSTIRAD